MRVPAYFSPSGMKPKSCPLGKIWCSDCEHFQDWEQYHADVYGPVKVHCSAPVSTKGKKTK